MIPLFVLTTRWEGCWAPTDGGFLAGCLAQLDDVLDGRLVIHGEPVEVVGAPRPRARRGARVPGPGRRHLRASAGRRRRRGVGRRRPWRWSRPTARGPSRPARCTPATVGRSRSTAPTCGRGASSASPGWCADRAPCRRSTGSARTACPRPPSWRRRCPNPARRPPTVRWTGFLARDADAYANARERPRRRRHLPPQPLPEVRVPPPPPGPGPSCTPSPAHHALRDPRAGVAGVLRRPAAPADPHTGLVPAATRRRQAIGDRWRLPRRRPLRGVDRGPHRLPDRRRRHAPAPHPRVGSTIVCG